MRSLICVSVIALAIPVSGSAHDDAPVGATVELEGICPSSSFKFKYYRSAVLSSDGSVARPVAIELIAGGESLPVLEVDKLNSWIGRRSIENATFFKCGGGENPSMAVAVEFQRSALVSDDGGVRVFHIRPDSIEIEP